MYTLIGSALLGALLMGRTKPKTKCDKKQLLGPRTGATYTVEDFVDAGFIVVTAADGSKGVFQRRAASPEGGMGFSWQHGRGKPATLRAIYLDMVGESPPQATTSFGPRGVPNAPPSAADPAPSSDPSSRASRPASYAAPKKTGGAHRGTP